MLHVHASSSPMLLLLPAMQQKGGKERQHALQPACPVQPQLVLQHVSATARSTHPCRSAPQQLKSCLILPSIVSKVTSTGYTTAVGVLLCDPSVCWSHGHTQTLLQVSLGVTPPAGGQWSAGNRSSSWISQG